MGIPTAAALADASEHVGRGFGVGRADLGQFHTLADRLGDFLRFLVMVEPIVEEAQPAAGAVLGRFRARLLEAVDAVQHAFDAAEPAALDTALGISLAGVLVEYQALGGTVALALHDAPLAA
jgi:hypothetical protein